MLTVNVTELRQHLERTPMIPSAAIQDHFEHPRHVGTLDPAAPDVGSGQAGNPDGGDMLKLYIAVNAAGTIVATRYQAYGGVAAIACGSWVSAWCHGKSLTEAADLHNRQVADALALPPLQIAAAVLAVDALQAAIADYRTKAAGVKSTSLSPTTAD
jgi:nitrogen fixation NifU-like protein